MKDCWKAQVIVPCDADFALNFCLHGPMLYLDTDSESGSHIGTEQHRAWSLFAHLVAKIGLVLVGAFEIIARVNHT